MKRTDDPQAVNGAPFLSRDDAESRVCKAIAALGRLAGIEVDQGEGPEDIDAVLIDAAYQCNFDDPDFLGGPCAFNCVETANDVDNLGMKAAPVIRGLLGYIRKRAGEETRQQAEAHGAMVEAAFAWLRTTCRP